MCLSHFPCCWNRTVDTHKLKEDRFILVHSLSSRLAQFKAEMTWWKDSKEESCSRHSSQQQGNKGEASEGHDALF